MQSPVKNPHLAILLAMAIHLITSCDSANSTADSGKNRAENAAARVRPQLETDLAAAALHFGDPVFIRAVKQERKLELFIHQRKSNNYQLFRTYEIAAASGILGPKLAEGDGQVPEGFYQVPPSAMNPNSRYHLSFNIGYPNAYDQSKSRTGSAIMIHGNSVSIGCLAMTDEKIEEIYTLCAAAHRQGQAAFRVDIYPFRMTSENLSKHSNPKWNDFWQNLKQGDELFEKTHLPPKVGVSDGRYTFTL